MINKNQKKLLTIYFIAIYTLSNAEEVKVKSEAKEATIFLSGAQLNNTANTQVSSGSHDIIFENLSPNIDANSIQAKGEGDFTILSVTHRLNYLNTQPKTKEIKTLEDSLESLQNKLYYQQSLKSVYTEEEAMLLANKNIGGENTGVTAAELEKVATLLRVRLSDIKLKQLEINAKEKKISEAIAKISNQLNELNTKRNRTTSEIVVSIENKTLGNVKISLTYLINDAGWTPVYDIKATDSNAPIKLVFKANVYQNTGVDWNKINITLSTGNPKQNGIKPQLNPWWLNFYQVSNYYKKAAKSKSYDLEMAAPAAMQEDNDISKYEEKAKTIAQYVNVAESQTNVQYEINIPYSVPSDGKYHAVEIQNYSIPATYKYYAIPKLDKEAFLLAQITGWDQYNLLSGEANIFYDGTYLGKSFLNTLNTNDTLDISLGRDKNIIISRTKLKDFSEKKIIGLTKKEVAAYEIIIRNKKKQEIAIDVEDQVPLSSNNEIEVENVDTGNASHDKDSGKLSWKLKINPSETKKLKFGYTVKYPKDKTINNL